MSSERFDRTVHAKLRPSRLLALLLLFVHGGALAVLAPLALPYWASLGMASAVVVSLAYTVNTHALLRSRRSIVQLVWSTEGDWTLLTLDGRSLKATLLPATYLHPRLVILNFRTEHRWNARTVVLLPDSLDASTFRRLRSRLALIK
jgi:toxin CptA